jgi:hypothetical protein
VSLDLPLDRVKLGHVALGGTKVQANASVTLMFVVNDFERA